MRNDTALLRVLGTGLKSVLDYKGQTKRADFWWFTLTSSIVTMLATYAGVVCFVLGVIAQQQVYTYIAYAIAFIGAVYAIWALLAWIAAGVRRLRDAGYQPWWMFIILVPVFGHLALILMQAQPSK